MDDMIKFLCEANSYYLPLLERLLGHVVSYRTIGGEDPPAVALYSSSDNRNSTLRFLACYYTSPPPAPSLL